MGQAGTGGIAPEVREPECAAKNLADSLPAQPSVHSADISAPALEAPGTDRWNPGVSSQAGMSARC